MAEKTLPYKLTLQDLFSKTMDSAVNATSKMDAKMSGLSSGSMMGAIVGGNLLTGAIQNAAGAVVDFAKDSMRAFGKQEQFLTSLKTMFHGNGVEAEVLNDKLKDLAKTTPFELTEIQDATKMMIAYGSTSTGVGDELRMLGDIGAGVGSSLSEVGYLYGTLRTQGRAFSKDIYQFTGRGIPIVKELAKQFGVTDDKVMKMVEDGKVGFKEVEKAFKSMTSSGGQFFGMMENQSKTLDGQLSNMSDSFGQLKVNVGSTFADMYKDVISTITNLINDANAKLSQLINSNKVLTKSGLGLSTSEKLFGQSNVDMAMYQEKLQAGVSGAGQSDKAYKGMRAAFENEGRRLMDQYKTASATGGDTKDIARRMALLNDALGKMDMTKANALRDAAGKSGASAEGVKGSSGGKSSGSMSSTDVSSARPQSLVININDGLVKQMNIYASTIKESASQIRQEVTKALLETANDSNLAAR